LAQPKQISRRRIGRLMNKLGLVSTYTITQYKPHHSAYNESPIKMNYNINSIKKKI